MNPEQRGLNTWTSRQDGYKIGLTLVSQSQMFTVVSDLVTFFFHRSWPTFMAADCLLHHHWKNKILLLVKSWVDQN